MPSLEQLMDEYEYNYRRSPNVIERAREVLRSARSSETIEAPVPEPVSLWKRLVEE